MTTRRQLLKIITAAAATVAVSSRAMAAMEIPAMTQEARSQLAPDQAIELLIDGNERFVSGKNAAT